jgi:ankyrin repeat protein
MTTCDIDDESVNGVTALHFAIYWPEALQGLIAAGVNINCADHNGRRPIHLAVACSQVDAVKFLLEADCSIVTPDYSASLLQVALASGRDYDNITELVIDALADRHSRLARLALSVLPDSSPARKEIQDDRLDESLAPKIEDALISQGFRIPTPLELDRHGEGVYDTSDAEASMRLTAPLADKLWRAGFRRIDEPARLNGLTPILQSWLDANFEMVAWFIDKGASPYSKHLDTSVSGLHLYATRLSDPGCFLGSRLHEPDSISESSEHIMRLANDEESCRDSCRCLCTVNGCTPVTTVLKYSWPHVVKRLSKEDGQHRIRYKELLLRVWRWRDRLIYRPDDEPLHQIQLLRILVFQKYGLQHTCCKMNGNYWASWETEGENCILNGNALEFQETLAEYERKMANCSCAAIERPICAVFRDSCSTMAED